MEQCTGTTDFFHQEYFLKSVLYVFKTKQQTYFIPFTHTDSYNFNPSYPQVLCFQKSKLYICSLVGTLRNQIKTHLPNYNILYKHIAYSIVISTYISYDIISGNQIWDDSSYTFSILSYFEESQTKNSSFHSYVKMFSVLCYF